ncbi:MAG: hypothetical protein Q4G49_04785 [Paracoccus sp. (in: a-proteobacteria)]|nr:hypothetical protein [Paracoccus sp. (in: a-proteobacteria)]
MGTWPFALLDAHLAGAAGVLLGQAFGGVIFAGVAWMLARRVMTDPPAPDHADHADRFAAQQGRLHALFGRRGW